MNIFLGESLGESLTVCRCDAKKMFIVTQGLRNVLSIFDY
jgi:hypothetical protein